MDLIAHPFRLDIDVRRTDVVPGKGDTLRSADAAVGFVSLILGNRHRAPSLLRSPEKDKTVVTGLLAVAKDLSGRAGRGQKHQDQTERNNSP